MRCVRRSLTVLVLAALATTAMSQVQFNSRGGVADAGDKISPILPGYAMCFGDGSGTPCPVGNMGKQGRGCENSVGLGGGLLWAEGEAKVSQDTVTLQVHYLPPGTTVLFMQSTGCRNKEFGLPFGDGLMCMGPVTRLGAVRIGGGDFQFPPRDRHCRASLGMLGQIPPVGGERYYQALYRDTDPFDPRSGFNLTNAWSMEWAP